MVLDAARVGDLPRLGHVGLPLDLVELGAHDVGAILALDAATVGDYPGGPATRHAALDRARATPGGRRRFFGVRTGRVGADGVRPAGELVAMSVVDLGGDSTAGIDFTVVAPDFRGRGLATALKAWSLLALAAAGVNSVRTGGSARNAAIIAVNARLGFVIDERWLTLTDEGARTTD